jgi:parallel beta-helix repeat protein
VKFREKNLMLQRSRSIASAWAIALLSVPLAGATYFVDPSAPSAKDDNPGTESAPWKTIGRAGAAKGLRPGDTVWIKSGVYRESVDIKVSGEPGKPITFSAAPDARVVIKGSEIVKGPWTRLGDRKEWKDAKEPFFGAFRRVWTVPLGDEFFTDARFQGSYADKSKRWVSQVFYEDDHPLQFIGPDPVYPNDEFNRLVVIGKGLQDMIPQSFFFDPRDQTLYLDIGGEPGWFSIEVGVRAFALTASDIHDVVIRGLELRHNRQPGGQWPLVGISGCQRVTVEGCRVYFADFNGLGLYKCKDCVVRRCDLSRCGCTGLALSLTEDCVVEDSVLTFNNYRRFCGDWGVAAGMKNIPGNRRTTVRRCVVAFNGDAEGIWFDTDNEDICILDNIVHDNGDCGIFFEINKGGGIIAGNLVYGNLGRGIYVSGSQNTWVVHNTVVENASGIVAMTRGKDEPPRNVRVLNNLLIRNYITAETVTRGSDLTLETSTDASARAEMGSFADFNVYANNSWTPFMRHNWNDNNPLPRWQSAFGQDKRSRAAAIQYERFGTGVKILAGDALQAAGPLPDAVSKVWRPRDPRRVGADLTEWPAR